MTFLAVDAARRHAPTRWQWLELRRVATLRREPNSRRDFSLLALSSERGVEARPEGGGRQLPSEATISDYWIVRPGDLVFNPMWAIGGSVAVSQVTGAVSPAYRVYSLSDRLEPRFLHYWVRSYPAVEQYRLLTRGITTFDRSVTREDFEGLPVPVPDRATQRRIAHFLDAETARIDALIEMERRMIALLRQKKIAAIDGIVAEAPERRRVKHLVLRTTSGPRGWAEFVAEEGDPFFRITNIQRDDIDLDTSDLVRVQPPAGAEALRTAVREGDVLVSITADIGSVSVARAEHAGGFVSQHIALLSPDACSGDWLAYALSTTDAQAQLDAQRYGGTKTQLSLDDVRNAQVPFASRDQQELLLLRVRAAIVLIRDLERLFKRQIGLLLERRQALITAAVTGELDLSEAA